MRFRQLNTGAVLDVKNEAVIEMMKASDAYVAVGQTKGKSGKEKEPAGVGKPSE